MQQASEDLAVTPEVAANVIYDLRAATFTQPSLKVRPQGGYEALLELSRAGSLTFDLSDVVRHIAASLVKEGSIE